ncbi:MAG: NADH-quinone oxidoreductase subunit L [Coriobacteriia bacterium]|jgi:NADH-quinone oxidoreductase subunit L|nr:NADH-quinone oxidoreductase subunit L [Coriobacteriia bacterium]
MAAILDSGWTVVVVPLVCALLVAAFGKILGRATPFFAVLGPLWVLTYGATWLVTAEGIPARGDSLTWLASGASGGFSVGWAVDGLAAVMLVVVGVVASLVVVFSTGYMAGESGLPRYFAALCLFTAAMSMLVIADGLLGLFIGWELVGACSYLLIGFWFTRPAAAKAAVKAFLTTRVGDMGLLLALALLWREVGDLSYEAIFAAAPALSAITVTAASLLLLFGAIGKSAQFPLQIWLPDAMEGPTPVSALIHAATMVAAGVFLIARSWPLFSLSADALAVTLAIGAVTAIGAATAALVQTDIKKVLAYSTISQLGFMFAALGVGAWGAAVFHLVTHAAFKALLFLGSGSVIHGCGSQDLREMGGLFKKMPVTGVTWLVGAGALAGLPPLAGFFSKDEILHEVASGGPAWAVLLFGASVLTAYYIARATRLAFFDSYRGEGVVHEGGWSMRAPLLLLAALALVVGFAGATIAARLGAHHGELDLGVAAGSTILALIGLSLGWRFAPRSLVEPTAPGLARLTALMRSGWGADALVERCVLRPVGAVSRTLYAIVDRKLIDGFVEGIARMARGVGRVLTSLQSGDVQWYATMLGAGVVALLALVSYIGRGW